MIIKRQVTSTNVTLNLDDSTKVRLRKGTFGLRKSNMGFTLVAGPQVSVEAEPNGNGKLVARTVKFKANSLKTANAIEAGLRPTHQELSQAQGKDDCYESNARNDRLRHGLRATCSGEL